jgi:hypothetical protein
VDSPLFGKADPIRIMNITTHQNTPLWPGRAKHVTLLITVAALVLLAFGFYTGHPVSFLKWFFGLQADD